MSSYYPSAFTGIADWSRDNSVTTAEGRVRFVQFVILRAITGSRTLSALLVFKGGNALDFVWHPNRSTQDLDFSADMAVLDPTWTLDVIGNSLREGLTRALDVAAREFGITLALHRLVQQPPGTPEKPFITYQGRIGYALPDQGPLAARMRQGLPSPQVVPIDISLHEPICADYPLDLAGAHPLRISTLEDIVAEKLRALLQQPIRRRSRRQDLLDIAAILRSTVPLDREQVAAFLHRKADARDVIVTRRAFANPDVIARASEDYDQLTITTRITFVPLDEALAELTALIAALPIPE